jgi:hypothetical protein
VAPAPVATIAGPLARIPDGRSQAAPAGPRRLEPGAAGGVNLIEVNPLGVWFAHTPPQATRQLSQRAEGGGDLTTFVS